MKTGLAFEEAAVSFACAGETLVGVLAHPAPAGGEAAAGAAQASARTGVLIVVGGPQYRAGSHRQFTLLARALAGAGYPSLRFDVRGMGDSSGAQQPFDGLTADIAAALDAAQRQLPQVERWVLWGLCDGASAALIYLDDRHDPRVQGLCLANPWVRSVESLAQTQLKHYYVQRVLQFAFWRKLLGGGLKSRALWDLGRTLKTYWSSRRNKKTVTCAVATSDFRQRMANGLKKFNGPVLLVLSANDFTAKEFVSHIAQQPMWQQALSSARTRRVDLPDADHTMSDPDCERVMHSGLVAWLNALPAGSPVGLR